MAIMSRITRESPNRRSPRGNPNKAVGVEAIPGTAVKVEKRTDMVLRVLNAVHNNGKISPKWKVARYSFRNRVETPHLYRLSDRSACF